MDQTQKLAKLEKRAKKLLEEVELRKEKKKNSSSKEKKPIHQRKKRKIQQQNYDPNVLKPKSKYKQCCCHQQKDNSFITPKATLLKEKKSNRHKSKSPEKAKSPQNYTKRIQQLQLKLAKKDKLLQKRNRQIEKKDKTIMDLQGKLQLCTRQIRQIKQKIDDTKNLNVIIGQHQNKIRELNLKLQSFDCSNQTVYNHNQSNIIQRLRETISNLQFQLADSLQQHNKRQVSLREQIYDIETQVQQWLQQIKKMKKINKRVKAQQSLLRKIFQKGIQGLQDVIKCNHVVIREFQQQ